MYPNPTANRVALSSAETALRSAKRQATVAWAIVEQTSMTDPMGDVLLMVAVKHGSSVRRMEDYVAVVGEELQMWTWAKV